MKSRISSSSSDVLVTLFLNDIKAFLGIFLMWVLLIFCMVQLGSGCNGMNATGNEAGNTGNSDSAGAGVHTPNGRTIRWALDFETQAFDEHRTINEQGFATASSGVRFQIIKF